MIIKKNTNEKKNIWKNSKKDIKYFSNFQSLQWHYRTGIHHILIVPTNA